jgi:hypothetical protein
MGLHIPNVIVLEHPDAVKQEKARVSELTIVTDRLLTGLLRIASLFSPNRWLTSFSREMEVSENYL